nr:thioredoxin domain-containing protein [Saprospiraceae bacterium]
MNIINRLRSGRLGLRVPQFGIFNCVLFFLCTSLIFFSCSSGEYGERKVGEPNALINESSPYLLQHADNPIDWHPWNEQTLQKARKEDKLILVSIGYSSCHWCHVMERESFMDEEIAKLMNTHFINIKVDREERPDVDQIYLNALQLLTGSGGWPLNAFALPDGRPFFAVTYLDPPKWLDLLERILKMEEEDYDSLIKGAEQITEGIADSEPISQLIIPDEFPEDPLTAAAQNQKELLDSLGGGYEYSPKFYYAPGLHNLLDHSVLSGDSDFNEKVHQSLWNIWAGGTYDHVGGGFARYATDREWKIPHFEKMLYDNAQLISLYSKAYRDRNNPIYERVVHQTISFLNRSLLSDGGAYFSSLDAESEGVEGLYYIWQKDEIKGILDPEAFDLFTSTFYITGNGNWEEHNSNIIYLDKERESKMLNQNYIELQPQLEKMREVRSNRPSPRVDEKILTSWNALLISGLIDAYKSFENPAYLNRAISVAEFINENMIDENGNLYRNFKDGTKAIEGFLDDYSYLIRALIDLYQVTFDEDWLHRARNLQEKAMELFFEEETNMFYFSNDPEGTLVVRRYEIPDNVLPSPNATSAQNLLILGDLFEDDEMMALSKQMLANVMDEIEDGGPFMASWAKLYSYLSHGVREVVVIGPKADSVRAELQTHHFPNAVYLGGLDEGTLPLLKYKLQDDRTMIYVCENRVCRLPSETVEDALKQLRLQDLTQIVN